MSRRTARTYRFLKLLGGPWGRTSEDVSGDGSEDIGPESGSAADAADIFAGEAVHRAADERIRLEAIRQLDTVNLDDEDPRIEPLPTFDSIGLFNQIETEKYGLAPAAGDEEWDEIQGRFVPSDQDGGSGS